MTGRPHGAWGKTGRTILDVLDMDGPTTRDTLIDRTHLHRPTLLRDSVRRTLNRLVAAGAVAVDNGRYSSAAERREP